MHGCCSAPIWFRLRGLPWLGLGKVFATALFAGAAAYGVSRSVRINGSRSADLLAIALIGVTWLAATLLGLWITRSDLPLELRRRGAPATPTGSGRETTSGGVEP